MTRTATSPSKTYSEGRLCMTPDKRFPREKLQVSIRLDLLGIHSSWLHIQKTSAEGYGETGRGYGGKDGVQGLRRKS